MRDRNESLEQLSEMLTKEQMRKVVTHDYSDISLSVMANFKKEYAEKFVDSKFAAQTMNKLTDAYANDRISTDDLYKIVDNSNYIVKNEPYVDEFLQGLSEGDYHTTATHLFLATNYEDCSYSQAADFMDSGAFYPTKFSSLSLINDTAKELEKMGVSLRGCKGFNSCYDVTDVQESIDNHHAIFVTDKSLAVAVVEMKKLPDWDKFRDEVKNIMGSDIGELTGDKLHSLHAGYVKENNSIALYEKVNDEHEKFISDIKKEPVDVIIGSAYEIVKKEDIMLFCQEYTPDLSEKQYSALLSSQNTLHDVYEQWCDNGELSSFSDIEVALAETADKLEVSVSRKIEETKIQEVMPEVKTPVVKPKHKGR